MIDAAKIEELRGLLAKATPGPWEWELHDYSMASLAGPRGSDGGDHVLDVSPCEHCQARAKVDGEGWKWGRCSTPSEENAALIVAMRNALPALLDLAASLASAGEDMGALAKQVVREVAELPDRTSPDDMPDMLLVTAQELHDIVASAAATRIRALASEKEGLRRELVARTHERDVHARSAFDLSQQSVDWQPQLSALRAENERLKAALEPFAKASARIDTLPELIRPDDKHDAPTYLRLLAEQVTIADLRRAHSELEAGHE